MECPDPTQLLMLYPSPTHNVGVFHGLTPLKCSIFCSFPLFKKGYLHIFPMEVVLHLINLWCGSCKLYLKTSGKQFQGILLSVRQAQVSIFHLFQTSSECLHVYVLSVDNCVSC